MAFKITDLTWWLSLSRRIDIERFWVTLLFCCFLMYLAAQQPFVLYFDDLKYLLLGFGTWEQAIAVLIWLSVAYFFAATCIRRLHDFGKSGRWILVVPMLLVLGAGFNVYYSVFAGTDRTLPVEFWQIERHFLDGLTMAGLVVIPIFVVMIGSWRGDGPINRFGSRIRSKDSNITYVFQSPPTQETSKLYPHTPKENGLEALLFTVAVLGGVLGLLGAANIAQYYNIGNMFLEWVPLGLAVIGLITRRRYILNKRNRVANKVLVDQKKSPSKSVAPFVLYLRPFDSTNVVTVYPTLVQLLLSGVAAATILGAPLAYYIIKPRLELESQLREAVSHIGPLLAVGKSYEHEQVGRIVVNDEVWRDEVIILMRHADLIILLPANTEGTKWEIDQILTSEFVKKTVFLDPTKVARMGRTKYNWKEQRAELTAYFSNHGFEFPKQSRKSKLFYYGSSQKPVLHRPLNLRKLNWLAHSFSQVSRLRASPSQAAGHVKK